MDSLDDEMPDFGTPEPLPLVVPDHPQEFDPEEPLPLVPAYTICKGVELDGKRCVRTINHAREFCMVHDPTPGDLMQLLVSRLENFVSNCAACGPASAEEILTIAAAAKAYGILWDRKPQKQAAEEIIKKVRFVKVS